MSVGRGVSMSRVMMLKSMCVLNELLGGASYRLRVLSALNRLQQTRSLVKGSAAARKFFQNPARSIMAFRFAFSPQIGLA